MALFIQPETAQIRGHQPEAKATTLRPVFVRHSVPTKTETFEQGTRGLKVSKLKPAKALKIRKREPTCFALCVSGEARNSGKLKAEKDVNLDRTTTANWSAFSSSVKCKG